MPLTGHADVTPTRKQARVELSAAPLSLNPPNISAAIRQEGGTKHISCAEWCRICIQVLEDIVEGTRKMLGWPDKAEAMHEILNVAKVMKTALSELNGSVSVDDDIFMFQPAMPAPPHDSSLDAFKLEVKDLFRNLEANIFTRISNVERCLSSGSASFQSAPSAHNGSNTWQQPPAPTTYTAAVKASPPGQPKPAQQPKATSTLPAAKPNTKFILTPEEFAQESELAGTINAATFTPLIVDEGLSFGSDYNALVYAANLLVLEDKGASDNLGKHLDPRKQEEWEAKLSTRYQAVADSFNDPASAQELDLVVQQLTDCFTQATNACMPDCKPNLPKSA
ncbi:hypothetical protein BDN71DRAFT_1511274 [Pleurotus eryngii]|uniref:Uncharacterized protein n=1 Tax=Pleurotus eryngii TaxID=5323 RepID=A0A9P6D2W8_PLEER|nr:hypothetical protein BDN71DRAFT_1511274 [Pleurotus eryngii]